MYDAVLLAGFGGPEGPADVMPFLRRVTAGRGVPPERLAEVAEHYQALGGVSPINAQTRALRDALAAELARRGLGLEVLWGNRNWHPLLAETLAGAAAAGHRRLLAVTTSAYASYSSCRQYREDLAGALIATDAAATIRIDKLRPYFDHPGFLAPFVDGVVAGYRAAAETGLADRDIALIFTTHSIPQAMSDTAGTAADGELYRRQHLAAAAEIVDRVGDRLGTAPGWQLAFQSRSGSAAIPWLEPDINDVITELAGRPGPARPRGVLVVPVGFISDHVEVIHDLDTEAAATAAGHGLWFHRCPTPGTDPRFVGGLADLIAARLTPDAPPDIPGLPGLAARPDVCPAGCCRPRTVRPTVAGLDSALDWAAAGLVAPDWLTQLQAPAPV